MVYSELMSTPADLDLDFASEKSSGYADLIATVVSTLKEDAAYENHEQGDTWTFTYGTASVFVHLSGETTSDTLSVWSPVLRYPVKDEAILMKTLLEQNWIDTFEARFCIWNDQVILHHYRALEGITPAEISRAITLVATLADEFDGPLQERFGAS